MNLDLTPQFVRDYEKDTKAAQQVPVLLAEIERLKTEVDQLVQNVKAAEATRKNLENKLKEASDILKRSEDKVVWLTESKKVEHDKHQAEMARKTDEINGLRSESSLLSKQLESLKNAIKQAQEALTTKEKLVEELTAKRQSKSDEPDSGKQELARKNKELEAVKAQLAEQSTALKTQMAKLWNARVASVRERILTEVDAKLSTISFVPLGTRFAALLFDLMVLMLVSSLVQSQPALSKYLPPEDIYIACLFFVFSLRAFVSPGRVLLGISPLNIGPDLRPTGPAGFLARLFCWLLHYGPVIATVNASVFNPATVSHWRDFLSWVANPSASSKGFSDLALGLFQPSPASISAPLLAATLIWWLILLVSILFSSLVHRGTPQFRNTTLVESLWRIGYQRFNLPKLKVEEIQVVS